MLRSEGPAPGAGCLAHGQPAGMLVVPWGRERCRGRKEQPDEVEPQSFSQGLSVREGFCLQSWGCGGLVRRQLRVWVPQKLGSEVLGVQETTVLQAVKKKMV